MSRRACVFLAVVAVCALEATSAHAGSDCADAAEAAQSARDDRKLLEARGLLRICAQARCPRLVRNDCTRWLQEVESAIPRVAFRVRRAGTEDGGELVVLDGTTRVPADGSAVDVDPGSHEAALESDKVKVRFVAAMGDTARVIELVVPPPAASAHAESPVRPPPSGAGASTTEHGSAYPIEKEKPSRLGPLALLGGGVLVGGVGAVFGVIGLGGWSDIRHDRCGTPCTESDVDRARTQVLVADIAIPVGLVLAGLGGYLLLRPRH